MILPGYSFRMFLITVLDRGLKFLVSSSKIKNSGFLIIIFANWNFTFSPPENVDIFLSDSNKSKSNLNELNTSTVFL